MPLVMCRSGVLPVLGLECCVRRNPGGAAHAVKFSALFVRFVLGRLGSLSHARGFRVIRAVLVSRCAASLYSSAFWSGAVWAQSVLGMLGAGGCIHAMGSLPALVPPRELGLAVLISLGPQIPGGSRRVSCRLVWVLGMLGSSSCTWRIGAPDSRESLHIDCVRAFSISGLEFRSPAS